MNCIAYGKLFLLLCLWASPVTSLPVHAQSSGESAHALVIQNFYKEYKKDTIRAPRNGIVYRLVTSDRKHRGNLTYIGDDYLVINGDTVPPRQLDYLAVRKFKKNALEKMAAVVGVPVFMLGAITSGLTIPVWITLLTDDNYKADSQYALFVFLALFFSMMFYTILYAGFLLLKIGFARWKRYRFIKKYKAFTIPLK